MPSFNGISMMPWEEWDSPDVTYASDACLEGCGALTNHQFFHKTFLTFIKELNLHINELELFTVVVLKVWGSGCMEWAKDLNSL